MASLPIASLLHATNAKKDNYAMSRAGYWKSLLQLTSGVSEYMRNPTVPCNHQISFAGIWHTCQNIQHIRHKIHFLSSRRPCQAPLSKLVAV